MGFWTRQGGERRRGRTLRAAVETMEGRRLPSAALPPPVVSAPVSIDPLLSAAPAPRPAFAAKPTPLPEQPGPAQDSSAAETVGKGGALAVKTAWDGYWMAHSPDVAHVGLNYAKLAVSHDTRKVGLAYLRAALRGDGNTLKNLSNTQAVRQVGKEFTALNRSARVQKLGNKFSQFGRSVASQFHKIFG